MTATLLEAIDLTKKFPIKTPEGTGMLHAVDGVSFEIRSGETVGLVGESGCGKSTLVRLLTRTLELSEGQIRFLGQDLGLVNPGLMPAHHHRKNVQMVFQDPHDSLNPRYTAFDTIAEPLRLLEGLKDQTAIREQVEDIATKCGLPLEMLDRFPHQLSGGQKARVGIARAAVLHPRLLVLDEPTAALDVSVQVVILQLLARLKQELGMSFLFVSHDLNVIRLLCDRVIVMYLGKLVESGPAQDVFHAPQHPYTRALIASIPGTHRNMADHLLPGEPTSPIRLSDETAMSCSFYGRCPHGDTTCSHTSPVLIPSITQPSRHVACHHCRTLPPF